MKRKEWQRILHAIWDLRRHEGTLDKEWSTSDHTLGYQLACDDIERAMRSISDPKVVSFFWG